MFRYSDQSPPFGSGAGPMGSGFGGGFGGGFERSGYGESRKKRTPKKCPFLSSGWKKIDYKDVETLRRFTTERGKILPRRITGVSAYFQRELIRAIKRARFIALMPFVSEE